MRRWSNVWTKQVQTSRRLQQRSLAKINKSGKLKLAVHVQLQSGPSFVVDLVFIPVSMQGTFVLTWNSTEDQSA